MVWDSPALSLTHEQTLFILMISSQFPSTSLLFCVSQTLPILTKAVWEGEHTAVWKGASLSSSSARVSFWIGPFHSCLGACFALCNPFAMIKWSCQTSVLWVFWQWSLKSVGSDYQSFRHSALLGWIKRNPTISHFATAWERATACLYLLRENKEMNKCLKAGSWCDPNCPNGKDHSLYFGMPSQGTPTFCI